MRQRAWYLLVAVAVLALWAPDTAAAQGKSKEKSRAKVERVKAQAPARSARSSSPARVQTRTQPVKVRSLATKTATTMRVTASPRSWRSSSGSSKDARAAITRWQPERVTSGTAALVKSSKVGSVPVYRGASDRDPPDRGNGLKRGHDDGDPPDRGNGLKRGHDDGDPRDRGNGLKRGHDKDVDRGRPDRDRPDRDRPDRDRPDRDRPDRDRPGDSRDRSWDSEMRKWDGVGARPVVIRHRVVRDRWVFGGYGPRVYDPYGYWHWHWYDDPFWYGHTSVVFVFRRGYGHHFHHFHSHFGHHHGHHLHHGFFHDFLYHHHGHVHFVIVVRTDPVYTTVPVYHAPVGWVIEERDVPVLVGERVPGAYYDSGSCARLEIVTKEGTVLPIRVDPADFGATNVGQLRDILEEALAATGQLDVEDLSGVRHVIPRESIREIRGSVCGVD